MFLFLPRLTQTSRRLAFLAPRFQCLCACRAGVLCKVVAHVLVELKLRANRLLLMTCLQIQVDSLAQRLAFRVLKQVAQGLVEPKGIAHLADKKVAHPVAQWPACLDDGVCV